MCGGFDCQDVVPDVGHLASYPFLPGGIDPMATKAYVITPHRIVDTELQRVVYSTGDRVPIEDAVKYGLIETDVADAVSASVHLAEGLDGLVGELVITPPASDDDDEPRRGKRRGGNRAHGPSENRSADDEG